MFIANYAVLKYFDIIKPFLSSFTYRSEIIHEISISCIYMSLFLLTNGNRIRISVLNDVKDGIFLISFNCRIV